MQNINNQVAKELERRVRDVLSSEEGYESVLECLPTFGSLYEFNVEDQGIRFYLYLTNLPKECAVFDEKDQAARPKSYERFVRYSNSSNEYLDWFEGRTNDRNIKWDGNRLAHFLLHSILCVWRPLFMGREKYMEYVKQTLAKRNA